jgi:antitoxin component YwqK of YwqJK toxin-antitoxin module
MRKISFIITVLTLIIISCNNKQSEKEQTEGQIKVTDSLSKVEQKKKADSLKRDNPLLIVPPDSVYTGDYTDKYQNGIVKFKGFFRFGKRHGQWMSFYPNGILWSELHFDKGLRHGLNATYFKNGKKRYEGVYKNDKQDSIWDYYDTTGILSAKVLYKNDVIVKKLPIK